MYQIMCDNKVLYDLRSDNRILINPKLTLESNKTGSLTFSKPVTNPVKIEKLKSVIEVYQDDTLLFSGRALSDEKDFYCTGKINCEGELAYLLDSIMRPYSFQNASVRDVLRTLIDNHNGMVEERKRFTLGNITVVDDVGEDDSVYRSSTDYTKTWDIIQDKLIKKLGGYLQVRRVSNTRYLDYLKECTNINKQVIRFRSNLLDLSQFTDATNVVTALIPLGKKDDNENYTTISSVNGGKDYIYDETAVSLYGWIWGTKQWEDVTVPSNLLTKSKAYMRDCINLALTLKLTAVDLSMLDVSIEKIKVGDWIRVISEPHGLDKYFLVTKLEIDLQNPSNNKITLGDTIQGLTDKQLQAKKDANSKLENANLKIIDNKKNIKTVDNKVTTVSNTVTDNKKQLNTQRNFIIMGL